MGVVANNLYIYSNEQDFRTNYKFNYGDAGVVGATPLAYQTNPHC
jgi:hypothetical protein